MVKKKTIFHIISAILGYLIGEISYYIELDDIRKYYENDVNKFDNNDILNLLFINKDFKHIDYMDEQNIMMLMIPIVFIFVGLLLSCEFFSKPQKYYPMIAFRTNDYRKMCKYIYGMPYLKILFYTISYGFTIAIHCKYKNNIIDIITMTIVYTLFICFLSHLTFLLYSSFNSGIAIMSSLVTLMLVYLLNMYVSGFNIILYNPNNHSIADIVTLFALITLMKPINSYVNRKRNLYVY